MQQLHHINRVHTAALFPLRRKAIDWSTGDGAKGSKGSSRLRMDKRSARSRRNIYYFPSLSSSSTASHLVCLGDMRWTKNSESLSTIGLETISKTYLFSAFLLPVHSESNKAKSLLQSALLKIKRVLRRVDLSWSRKDFNPDQHLSPFWETQPLLFDWITRSS